ncbi:MAG TPA: class I SAM-dependent methyltransferase [Sporichthyaceae bacterium]|nr:class I SAM-dependent methyltransferase [Sporichthyaceae bacterium]
MSIEEDLAAPVDPTDAVALEAAFAIRRSKYQAEIADGIESFFNPRRDTCPWCSSPNLTTILRTGDRNQRKPGRFVLDRCRTCRHVFQNPMLNPTGLDFYYRDFYDGLGRSMIETVFDQRTDVYQTRARQLLPCFPDGSGPKNWLDIGAGFGHFCRDAKTVFPDTVFDGLDQGLGVVEAAEKGWIDTAHRGWFPDLAEELTGRYDVISMFHYLEHVLDIRAELDLAAAVLPSGGLLQIEVPNPESRLRALRGWWVQWFQPQHLHFAPLPNLLAALNERGLRPVSVQFAESHIPVDVTCAMLSMFAVASPEPRLPWLTIRQNKARWAYHQFMWAKLCPKVLPWAYKADAALTPVVKRTGDANLYRVLARKV